MNRKQLFTSAAAILLLAGCSSVSGIQDIGQKTNLDGSVTDYRAVTIKADNGPVQIRSESRDYTVVNSPNGPEYKQVGQTQIAVTGGNDLNHDLGVAAMQIPAAIAGGLAVGLSMQGTTVNGSSAKACQLQAAGTGANTGDINQC